MRLHVVHGHSHLCQLYHYRGNRAGKDCIGFCQYFQILALCLHSLHDCLYVFDHLMVLFWRGRWCNIYVLHYCDIPAFSCGCYRYFLLSVFSVVKQFIFCPRLELGGFCLNSLMSSLKISGCARRVINFYIIIAPDIVWPLALANSLFFSNCLVSQARGSAGSYGPIILTAFSLRLISSITPWLANICCSMVIVDTCTKPVS